MKTFVMCVCLCARWAVVASQLRLLYLRDTAVGSDSWRHNKHTHTNNKHHTFRHAKQIQEKLTHCFKTMVGIIQRIKNVTGTSAAQLQMK